MKSSQRCLAAILVGLLAAAAARASPRLEIGPLTRRLELPGLRACYVARALGASGATLRFLSTGTVVYSMDPADKPWPIMNRTTLFGAVTDPELGALLCTRRGVPGTRNGH